MFRHVHGTEHYIAVSYFIIIITTTNSGIIVYAQFVEQKLLLSPFKSSVRHPAGVE